MQDFLTTSNVTFMMALLGILFSIYHYFKNPQIDIEKKVDGLTKELAIIRAAFEGHLLADQASFGLLNSHIVEVDKSVVKLTTIIDERIPRK